MSVTRSGHCAVRQVMLNRPFRRLRLAQRTMMSNRQVGRDILERPSKERIRRGGGPDQLSQNQHTSATSGASQSTSSPNP
jgi:hypothetical protein